ncbi:MAG: hypothetical protein V4857_04230 [Pseudomonadota bacterium]
MRPIKGTRLKAGLLAEIEALRRAQTKDVDQVGSELGTAPDRKL